MSLLPEGDTIGVVLNAYKRLHRLEEQINAVINQTFRPSEIIIWNNSEQELNLDLSQYSVPITVFSAMKNTGVWSRFFAGLNCNTKYIAVFDDDTIPGKQWFDNCIDSMAVQPGLYGSVGIRFNKGKYFPFRERCGWCNQNENIEEVDIVGHAWFFERDWLKYFMNDIPNTQIYKTTGEDFHLSYALRKYGNIRTYVPPHPASNHDMWGSIKAVEYGTDDAAIYMQPGAGVRFESAHNYWIEVLGHPLVMYQ